MKPHTCEESADQRRIGTCKVCGKQMALAGLSERGRFMVAAEKAVADLQLPEYVQEEMWTLLHTNVSAWVRQSYLTADFNAKVRRAEAASKKVPT